MMTEDDRTTTETSMTGEERTTTEIITIATTPQITTEGDMIEDTWNDVCTQIRMDGTRNVRDTRTTNATTDGEIFSEKSVRNQLEGNVGSRIQICMLHNQSNGGRK